MHAYYFLYFDISSILDCKEEIRYLKTLLSSEGMMARSLVNKGAESGGEWIRPVRRTVGRSIRSLIHAFVMAQKKPLCEEWLRKWC